MGMKKTLHILQLLTLLVALFFVVMGVNALFESKPLMDRILSFLVSILPAILIILIPIFLRQNYKLSGWLYMGLAIIYFVFFRPYRDIAEGWPVLVIVVIPLFIIGAIHVLYDYKKIN